MVTTNTHEQLHAHCSHTGWSRPPHSCGSPEYCSRSIHSAAGPLCARPFSRPQSPRLHPGRLRPRHQLAAPRARSQTMLAVDTARGGRRNNGVTAATRAGGGCGQWILEAGCAGPSGSFLDRPMVQAKVMSQTPEACATVPAAAACGPRPSNGASRRSTR